LARIRTIKPEFWTNERVMECSMIARLMFIGMWNFADDLGRLPFSVKTLKAQIFPSDDINSENILGMIRELAANGLVLTYEVDGRQYIQITGWQHQRIDKPQPGKCPAPVNGYSENVLGMVATEGKGKEGKVEEEKKETREDALVSDFEAFWKIWPNKVGRPAALKAFRSAVKRASPGAICDGVVAYERNKPPDRPWLNPATFLNQNRWEDQPALVGAPNAKVGQFDAAYHNVLEKLNAGFGGPAPEERFRPGESEADVGLLAYRGSQ
jgi:hypothetical protein